jgi:hypothetical protein
MLRPQPLARGKGGHTGTALAALHALPRDRSLGIGAHQAGQVRRGLANLSCHRETGTTTTSFVALLLALVLLERLNTLHLQLEPLGNLINAIQRCVMDYKLAMVKRQSSPGTAFCLLRAIRMRR